MRLSRLLQGFFRAKSFSEKNLLELSSHNDFYLSWALNPLQIRFKKGPLHKAHTEQMSYHSCGNPQHVFFYFRFSFELNRVISSLCINFTFFLTVRFWTLSLSFLPRTCSEVMHVFRPTVTSFSQLQNSHTLQDEKTFSYETIYHLLVCRNGKCKR